MRVAIDFSGAVVVVTGSTRGLGRAIAQSFADSGASVGINGRSVDDVQRVVASNEGFFAAPADLTDAAEAAALADAVRDRFGQVDALVCNAGGGRPDRELDTHDEWMRVLSLNLLTAVHAVDAFLPIMTPSTGAICVVSSIAGVRHSGAPAAYAAAKAALNSYVSSAAAQAAKSQVRVTGVAPGNLLFDGSTWDDRQRTDPAGVETMLRERVPLGRFGSPDEIANWCLFLTSPYASFATGSVHVVDGGQLA